MQGGQPQAQAQATVGGADELEQRHGVGAAGKEEQDLLVWPQHVLLPHERDDSPLDPDEESPTRHGGPGRLSGSSCFMPGPVLVIPPASEYPLADSACSLPPSRRAP